jgi:hypothetical protein
MSRKYLRDFILTTACLALVPAFGQTGSKVAPGAMTASTTERHYILTARVRPVLFWISRSGVGGAKIAWKEDIEGTRQIELLIGSDPERTPMRINRWGYISESLSGSSLELLGVMTESEEESVDQARHRIEETGARHAFKAIRGKVCDRRAEASVIHMLLTEDYTYRDLDLLLLRLPETGRVTPAADLPAGVEPGFLLALKSTIHKNVERLRAPGKTSGFDEECLFVFNGDLYRLTARSSGLIPSVTVNGRSYKSVVETRFQTRKVRTGTTSAFTITYGVEEPIREIPIRIVYRPRWWFEADLQLTDAPLVSLAVKETP